MKQTNLKLKNYLSEAINFALEGEKVKLKDHVALDIGLESNFEELFNSFINHIEMIKKINKLR